ncbi:MFS transporter [Lentilactobacillus buchneri]|uniref:Major facilitator superfamily (MFS) profile domain-containing protein n=1 Tax=Lentilactobacillus buchneri DSM 20057 TaxID=1423728 RepID=A0A4R5NTU1_LENBU|nr:MFS transporter [Lentilactobacillus buchneri]KRK67756.1 major facilitator superfamily protein [Lentilactobacillus buchneri DSM 20057]MCT3252581.1 MFS transporter [Lentilactobacillus buchneri]MCT3547174.1 MFS transporter [Lentilactobacillus buchneri]MCT4437654.1 MFS transporter [Lentilactobacillus buchneri]MQM71320.1 MFS transporter [Lentilactobacillus buchneri]
MSKKDEKDLKAVEPAPEPTNAKVTNAEEPKFPKLFGLAMLIGPFVWLAPAGNVRNTLLPQYFSQIAPNEKVALVALLASVSSIVAAVANILFGGLSDITRTRWGKRKPWILGGTIVESGLICIVANIKSIWLIVVLWGIVAAAENAVAAAMVAQEADRIAPRWRGTISTLYGIGYTAIQLVAMIAAQFLGKPKEGMYVMAGIGFVMGIIHVLFANEGSNLDEPREKFSWSSPWLHFSLPTKGARDYWYAVAGKLMMVMGGTIATAYMLYILTDYMHLGQQTAGKTLAEIASINLIFGVVFTAISGPIADKVGRLKAPVALSTLLIGIAQFFPFFAAKPWTILTYAVLAAIGNGVYNAVDGALNLAVLPNAETSGKDMGFINLANTLSQISGTVVASLIVTYLGGYKAIFPASFLIELVGAILIFRIKSVK